MLCPNVDISIFLRARKFWNQLFGVLCIHCRWIRCTGEL